MRYYRRYRKRSYKRSNYVESGPSTRYDIINYLKQEFFNADYSTFQKIANFYSKNYGHEAYKYLLKTYPSWKTGTVSISSLTQRRILECVPNFLSPEKRLFILKKEIHNFFEKAKTQLRFQKNDLADIYISFQKQIFEFNEHHLNWFIGRNIFKKEQVEHYINICKYALNEKLLQSHKQVMSDLWLINEKLSSSNVELEECSYKIDFLNVTLYIDLEYIKSNLNNKSSLSSLALKIDDSLKKYGEDYILHELLKMSFSEKMGVVNSKLKANDIDIFFGHFKNLSNQNSEAVLSSTFQGEGGRLTMKVEFIPYANYVESIVLSCAKILLIIISTITVAFLILFYKLYWILIVLILGGWAIFYSMLSAIPEEVTKIRKAANQIKKYGQ